MKVKRLKRAKKILNFFHHKYKYTEPYHILLDGTVCQASLQNKINLREQFPKYLDSAVELCTTKCVLAELERLGREVYGALKICQQYEVIKCPHKPAKTAAACIEYLARRGTTHGKPKFLIASQDEQLLYNLRDHGGVPLLSIKFNTILMEKPSKESENASEEKTAEMRKLEELKEQLLAQEEVKKHKKRKIKGPNPLSCKKKNKKLEQAPKKDDLNGEKKKARRKKRTKNKESASADA